LGTFAGLIVLVVVGAIFMTAEYRRRLILITLTAAPRAQVLAAKVTGGQASTCPADTLCTSAPPSSRLRRHALAIGAILRRGVLPYLLTVAAPILPAGLSEWILRLTPAAGFAVQQTMVQYSQVDNVYSAANGYYPLAPWAGLAVLCAWTALALGLAVFLLRRRDA
jgi:hypothetical protein